MQEEGGPLGVHASRCRSALVRGAVLGARVGVRALFALLEMIPFGLHPCEGREEGASRHLVFRKRLRTLYCKPSKTGVQAKALHDAFHRVTTTARITRISSVNVLLSTRECLLMTIAIIFT